MRAPSSKWRDGRPGLPAGPRGKRELRTCPPYWRIGSKRLPGEEEVAQAPGGLVGQLFGDELAGRHGVALQPAGALGAPEAVSAAAAREARSSSRSIVAEAR